MEWDDTYDICFCFEIENNGQVSNKVITIFILFVHSILYAIKTYHISYQICSYISSTIIVHYIWSIQHSTSPLLLEEVITSQTSLRHHCRAPVGDMLSQCC